MKFTLKKKLVLSVLLVIFIFGSIATVGVFLYSKNLIFNLQKENLRKFSVENSNVVLQLFNSIRGINISITQQADIKEYLRSDNPTLQEGNILRDLNIYKINDSFDVIYLMDKNGLTLVSTDETFLNNNYSFRDYFQGALQGNNTVDVSLGVTSKKLGYYFSAPVFDNDGSILGVSVIKIKPEIINSVIDISSYEEDSYIMMLDSYGVIVYADKQERLYKSISTLSANEKQIIADKRIYEGIDIESIQYEEVGQFLDSSGTNEVINFYDKLDGEDEMVSVSRVGDLDFFLVIEEETDKYISVANYMAITLSLIVLISALISVLMVFLFINSFIKPINQLKKTAQEIADGKLSSRVNVKTGDEIEELAIVFNAMAANMEKNIKNIEAEVSRRTKKLEELNAHMVGRELKMIELKNKLKNKNKI